MKAKRILRFILIDLFFLMTIGVSFLFNSSSDLKINILLMISVLIVSSYFEIVLLAFYILTIVFDLYRKHLHTILFSLIFIYINYITFQYWQEDRIIHFPFFAFELLLSIILLCTYSYVLSYFDKKEMR